VALSSQRTPNAVISAFSTGIVSYLSIIIIIIIIIIVVITVLSSLACYGNLHCGRHLTPSHTYNTHNRNLSPIYFTLSKILSVLSDEILKLSCSWPTLLTFMQRATLDSLLPWLPELSSHCYKKNSMVWVRERTIPTERPPPVGEVIANFCGERVPRGQRDGSLRPYSRFSRQEPLLFYQVAPQLYSQGSVDPIQDPLLFFGSAGNRTRASGSVARNSDH
jgi:hypothetical protein